MFVTLCQVVCVHVCARVYLCVYVCDTVSGVQFVCLGVRFVYECILCVCVYVCVCALFGYIVCVDQP